jgi:hypothetical protein
MLVVFRAAGQAITIGDYQVTVRAIQDSEVELAIEYSSIASTESTDRRIEAATVHAAPNGTAIHLLIPKVESSAGGPPPR